MNQLIKKFGKEKRWVNYKLVELKGKFTKIPYSITGKKASSVDQSTWATYNEAFKTSPNVGIVFTPDQNLLGIDIDHCLDQKTKNINHEKREMIADLILDGDTYTEISPSGEGLHLFFALESPLKLVSNKKAPFEAYTSGRYFTFTGNCYGKEKPVRTITVEEAEQILSIIGYPWGKDEEPKTSTPDTPTKVGLSDDEVVRKMLLSQNGKIKPLYEGNLIEYKNDASSGDMALCSHLAFWTRKDAEQMERIWLASPLGKRDKTQKRKDYRERTISSAIANCQKIYETPKIKMESENPDINLLYTVGPKGEVTYIQNTENMSRILSAHHLFKGNFRYDIFKNIYEICDNDKWRLLEDNDAVEVQTKIQIHFSDWFGRVGKDMVYDAIIKVAKENQIDSAKDWIVSLKWDGVARLDHWLSKTYHVEDNVYHRAVASNWLKGLVKRVIEPGCKFDYVLVLEGEQGTRKSTSLSVLGRDWHVETTMSTDSKDFFMQFQGKAIIEFSEGETLSRTEVKRMKAIITMQSDKYRPPYERSSQDFPRRCVFAMTTNQSEYLKDETGNRRWLPVTVIGDADVDWLEENRDQIFAEAYYRLVELKETTYDFPKEETLAQQAARRISDPNEDIIMEWYYKVVSDSDKEKGITITRVYKEALHGNFPNRPINKFEQMSIASVLKDHLKLTKRDSIVDGIRATRWFNETGTKMVPENETISEKELKEFWSNEN